MLFDPRAHEPLLEAAWSSAAAASEIRAIARSADEALRGRDWWAWHPLDRDDGDPEVVHGVYLGAAGVLWALDWLSAAGLHEPAHDYARLAGDVLESYLSRPEWDGPLLGEPGIALVAWLLSPSRALEDRLAELVVVPEPEDADTLEWLWGSPGLLLIADAVLARTGAPRWAAAWSALADYLMRRWGERVLGFWTQRLPGWPPAEIVGAGHGMAGVVAALALRPELLPHGRLVPGVVAALSDTALREGEPLLANWPPALDEGLAKPDGSIRTQWCHGAAGIVTSMAALAGHISLDALLLAGGELTWAAGPLRKGAGLCHGSAGNGFALLKLFTRTGNEEWLARARRFGMHATAQVAAARRQYGRGRHTLWTGDLGTAIFLQQCLAATSDMPTIDFW